MNRRDAHCMLGLQSPTELHVSVQNGARCHFNLSSHQHCCVHDNRKLPACASSPPKDKHGCKHPSAHRLCFCLTQSSATATSNQQQHVTTLQACFASGSDHDLIGLDWNLLRSLPTSAIPWFIEYPKLEETPGSTEDHHAVIYIQGAKR